MARRMRGERSARPRPVGRHPATDIDSLAMPEKWVPVGYGASESGFFHLMSLAWVSPATVAHLDVLRAAISARAEASGGALVACEPEIWRGRPAIRVIERLRNGGCRSVLSVELSGGMRFEVTVACTNPDSENLDEEGVEGLTRLCRP